MTTIHKLKYLQPYGDHAALCGKAAVGNISHTWRRVTCKGCLRRRKK